jgi:hypothetical protein
MTLPFPMLTEFALRLAGGLAALLLLTPWRLVPPKFFRTHCLVILGLLVLAWLDASRIGIRGPLLYAFGGLAGLAYLSTVVWGVGLPRVALPVTGIVALGCACLFVHDGASLGNSRWLLDGMSRLASAFLLGSTLSAMLLGHYYLTAPAMSINPLKRFVRCMACGLGARTGLAGYGLWVWFDPSGRYASNNGISLLFLVVRFGVGLLGPAVATWMTWQTVRIRSTQSATGILYIAMILVLFGELTAMVLFQDSGVMF